MRRVEANGKVRVSGHGGPEPANPRDELFSMPTSIVQRRILA